MLFTGDDWSQPDRLIAAVVPDDHYVMGTFHLYFPTNFAEGRGTWGGASDRTALHQEFEKVSAWSAARGVPVLLGEFGAVSAAEPASRRAFYAAYVGEALSHGFAFTVWDDGGRFCVYNRAARDWNELKDILIATPPNRADVQPFTETADLHETRLKWWREARFGMFIHFGLYAIPGRGEWAQWNEQIPVGQYAKLAQQFNPDFKPDGWAAIAKAAGMKCMALTARHHDGFCLFDDGTNRFMATKTAARRDLVAEYVKAVRKAGLHAGLYYSPLDWRFPGYFFPDLCRQSAEAMRDHV